MQQKKRAVLVLAVLLAATSQLQLRADMPYWRDAPLWIWWQLGVVGSTPHSPGAIWKAINTTNSAQSLFTLDTSTGWADISVSEGALGGAAGRNEWHGQEDNLGCYMRQDACDQHTCSDESMMYYDEITVDSAAIQQIAQQRGWNLDDAVEAAVAHEFGHALALHDSTFVGIEPDCSYVDSIMYPGWTSLMKCNRKAFTSLDAEALHLAYYETGWPFEGACRYCWSNCSCGMPCEN